MALIVEDGSIVPNAESYCSVTYADVYHSSRGNSAWDDVDDKEAALRRATDYMVQMYRSNWAGNRVTAIQALDWPRYNVPLPDGPYHSFVDITVIPDEIKKACAELALRAATQSLAPDQGRVEQSVSVGPISVSYAPGSMEETYFKSIESMLAIYWKSASFMRQIGRA